MKFDFSDSNVVVTGSSRGIGFAVAEAFCAANANVTLIAETDEVFSACEQLSAHPGSKVNGIKCDISDPDQVRRTFAALDRIDVLVNNAGLELITPILATADDGDKIEQDFKRIIDINVMGTFYVSRNAVAKMPSGSSIIITCSIWSRTAVAEFSAYCASKHATLGFMRSMDPCQKNWRPLASVSMAYVQAGSGRKPQCGLCTQSANAPVSLKKRY